MAKFVGIVALLLLVPPLASAQIYKCVAKDGTDLYQNFPCDVDSIGSVATNAPSAMAGSPPGVAKQAQTGVPVAAGAMTAKSPAAPAGIRIGMTEDEVRALLGAPEEMVADEPAEGGPVSLWRYAGGRSVKFDHQHRVLEVQL